MHIHYRGCAASVNLKSSRIGRWLEESSGAGPPFSVASNEHVGLIFASATRPFGKGKTSIKHQQNHLSGLVKVDVRTQFARDGVRLLGHLQGIEDGKLKLAADLWDSLASADQHEAEFVKSVDGYIARIGLRAPVEHLPVLRDGFAVPLITGLDLEASGITNVIWATSYAFDFSFVKLPVFDSDGFPIQKEGMTAFPGLAFAGLPWLPNAKSGLLYGAGENARSVAEAIMRRELASSRRKQAA